MSKFSKIIDNLFIGCFPDDSDIFEFDLLINLSRSKGNYRNKGNILHCPLTYWEMDNVIQILMILTENIQLELLNNKKVAIHCRLGIDRTGLLVLAFLARYKMKPEDAILFYKKIRKGKMPRDDAMKILEKFFICL